MGQYLYFSNMACILGAILFLSQHYTLDGIKSRTVGDGQHGTARWATKKEISGAEQPAQNPGGQAS